MFYGKELDWKLDFSSAWAWAVVVIDVEFSWLDGIYSPSQMLLYSSVMAFCFLPTVQKESNYWSAFTLFGSTSFISF